MASQGGRGVAGGRDMASASTWATQAGSNAKPLEQNVGSFKDRCSGPEWWRTALMHREVDLGEFEASLIFIGNSRASRATTQ